MLQGIAVAKHDPAFTLLIADALNVMIKDGAYDEILSAWGIKTSELAKAEVDPNPTP